MLLSFSHLVSLVLIQLEDSLLTCNTQQFFNFPPNVALFEDIFVEVVSWIIQNILLLLGI